MNDTVLLFNFLRQPVSTIGIARPSDWTQFLQSARKYGLLATYYTYFKQCNVLGIVPKNVQRHLLSGQNYADKQAFSLANELLLLEQVFADANYPCLFLKGTAYRCAGFNYAKGRLFSDIDLLIPKDCLDDANMRLLAYGYVENELSAYDRNYYLQWSHQLPPKHNLLTGASLDLHHHIFPVVSSLHLQIAPFFQYATQLSGSKFQLCSPSLMFVHACVHLFYQEESHKLIKDVVDLWMLFDQVSDSLCEVREMAIQVKAQQAVAYGFALLSQIFETELDTDTKSWLLSFKFKNKCMIWLIKTMLYTTGVWNVFAHCVWFLRGHLLKMGPITLIYHLSAKTINQLKERRLAAIKQKELDRADMPKDAH